MWSVKMTEENLEILAGSILAVTCAEIETHHRFIFSFSEAVMFLVIATDQASMDALP